MPNAGIPSSPSSGSAIGEADKIHYNIGGMAREKTPYGRIPSFGNLLGEKRKDQNSRCRTPGFDEFVKSRIHHVLGVKCYVLRFLK
jgi:hypothetical protein